MFNTMFERATVFSAVLLLLFLGIVGMKYFKFLETKNQLHQTFNIQYSNFDA